MEENNAKKTFSRLGFAQAAGIAGTILASKLLLSPLTSEANLQKIKDTAGASMLLLMMYIPQIAYLLVFWLLVRTMPKPDWQKENLNFKKLLTIFLIMYSISSILSMIGSTISKAAPAGGDEQLDLINKIESTKLLMGILIPVVIGPILEELIFRKLILDRCRCYGEKTAIIFSAVCFGLFHGNLTQFLFAGCIGLFLGYVYCKTGKVLITIIMHMLVNGFGSLITLFLPLIEGWREAGKDIAVVGLGILILAIVAMHIAGIILLIRSIKKKSFATDDSMPTAIPQNEVLRTVYLNPGVLLLLALTIFEIVITLLNLDINLIS